MNEELIGLFIVAGAGLVVAIAALYALWKLPLWLGDKDAD